MLAVAVRWHFLLQTYTIYSSNSIKNRKNKVCCVCTNCYSSPKTEIIHIWWFLFYFNTHHVNNCSTRNHQYRHIWINQYCSMIVVCNTWKKKKHLGMIKRNERGVDKWFGIRIYFLSCVIACIRGRNEHPKDTSIRYNLIFCHFLNFDRFANLLHNGFVWRLLINTAIWWVTLPPIAIVSYIHFAKITGIIFEW